MKKVFPALFALVLLSLRAEAQCYGVISPPPPGTVCGSLWKPGWRYPAMSFSVAFCPPGGTFNCRGANSFTAKDGWGRNVEAYTVYNWGGTSNYEPYNVFIHNDFYWGSPDTPITTVYRNNVGVSGLNFIVPPRPLPPTPIYPPAGGQNIPNSYLVQWYSGIDADRAGYPATWEIWFKYWLPNEPQPTQWSLARDNMPCHDDGSGPDWQGRCSTFVTGPQPAGNWAWKVVANLDVTSALNSYSQVIFRTESSPAYFVGQ